MTLVATYSFYFLFVFHDVSCFIALGTNLVNLTLMPVPGRRDLCQRHPWQSKVSWDAMIHRITASTSFNRNMSGLVLEDFSSGDQRPSKTREQLADLLQSAIASECLLGGFEVCECLEQRVLLKTLVHLKL